MQSKTKQIDNFFGSGLSLSLTKKYFNKYATNIVICSDINAANKLAAEIKFFSTTDLNINIFPDWETLPYDKFSPQTELSANRLYVLSKLINNTPGVYIIALPTLLVKLIPRNYLVTTEFLLKKDQTLSLEELKYSLVLNGYDHNKKVIEHGEFATRGSLLDLFPGGATMPYRIDFFDNTIESIKTFDPLTQRTLKEVDSIKMLGACEYPLAKNNCAKFAKKWEQQFPEHNYHKIYNDIKAGKSSAGAEYFLPFFYDSLSSFFDYIPKNSSIYFPHDYKATINKYLTDVQARYKDLTASHKPILSCNSIYFNYDDIAHSVKNFSNYRYATKELNNSTNKENISSLNDLITTKDDNLTTVIDLAINSNWRMLLTTNSATKLELYENILRKNNINTNSSLGSWDDFIKSSGRICLMLANISDGFKDTEQNTLLITESDLTQQPNQLLYNNTSAESLSARSTENLIDLDNINIGQLVVHEEYGIGKYLGLEKMSLQDATEEYIAIEYANKTKLYIPIFDLAVIYPYRSAISAKLDKLGNQKWQKTKRKAIDKMIDNAAELLELYAKRESSTPAQYKEPDKDYYNFCNEFPFNETVDQAKAINSVIADLCSSKLTDRLICGDVGFGKTEIAMRAAFLAVHSGMQAVLIVPTTLLATQHYNNFCDRFIKWPIKVRLYAGTNKENTKVKADINTGNCDIIIATHKILSKDIIFHNLGLLIIDEEHRFGVTHKEKLKNIKVNIDIITLTATPIPRTLQLSLASVKDLSIIATPPVARVPIQTHVGAFDEDTIKDAVTRELNRGGQIYYLYNDVANMLKMAKFLQRLLPNIKIAIAHGQMPQAKLDNIMHGFYHKQYDLCLCTTIIESGIDVPNANTIIIDRADKLGLAQLHQIRGRVGRAHHQAYAYLFTPDKKYLTKDACQRLEAIAENNKLGSGFQLAIMDMEIRGAGEMLGDEQSGHIRELGFDYYIRLVKKTAKALKDGQNPSELIYARHDVKINTTFPIIIPSNYVIDISARFNMYKKLTSINSFKEKMLILDEITDLYGKLPTAVKHLAEVNLIKTMAEPLLVDNITLTNNTATICFNEKPKIDAGKLIDIVTKNSHYKFSGNTTITITYETNSIEQILYDIYELLINITL
jgi:transcription-repair coupling factor (superfamily II helicase)